MFTYLFIYILSFSLSHSLTESRPVVWWRAVIRPWSGRGSGMVSQVSSVTQRQGPDTGVGLVLSRLQTNH